MRKILCIVFACLFALLGAAVYSGSAEAASVTNNTAVVDDRADLLTDDEESTLIRIMQGVLPYGNAAVLTADHDVRNSEDYAREAYLSLFGQTSGTLFFIDLDNHYLQFFSGGDMYKTLTTGRTNEITDNVYTYASDGLYYDCAAQAYLQVITILEGGRISTPMKYVTNAVLAVGLVLMVNLWIVFAQRKKPDPAKPEDTFSEPHRGGVHQVHVVMTKQTKHRHSEGGGVIIGGGGGGFGGGGGGFSGGGGGHSF